MVDCVMYMPELGELLLEDGNCVKIPEHILTFSDIEMDVSRIEYWATETGVIGKDVSIAYQDVSVANLH